MLDRHGVTRHDRVQSGLVLRRASDVASSGPDCGPVRMEKTRSGSMRGRRLCVSNRYYLFIYLFISNISSFSAFVVPASRGLFLSFPFFFVSLSFENGIIAIYRIGLFFIIIVVII